MANWKFWQKKQATQDPDVPQEVREYYESSRANPRARALLVAIITLIVTLLVAYGLFLAGRWVYNQFTEDDQPQVVEVLDEDQGSVTIEGDNTQPESDSQSDSDGSSSTETPQTLPGDGSQGDESEARDTTRQNGQESSRDTGSSTGGRSAQTPTTGSQVPDTGPGSVVAIFTATSLGAAGVHAVITRKRR